MHKVAVLIGELQGLKPTVLIKGGINAGLKACSTPAN